MLKDAQIANLESAVTESEVARLESEEKMLDYFRFEGHIHRQARCKNHKFD